MEFVATLSNREFRPSLEHSSPFKGALVDDVSPMLCESSECIYIINKQIEESDRVVIDDG